MICGENFDVMNQPDILPGRVKPRDGRVEISARAHLWKGLQAHSKSYEKKRFPNPAFKGEV